MSPRTGKPLGRPKSENPKDTQIKFLADKQTVADISYCCEKMSKTKSDVIRLGIQMVKSKIEK